MARSARKSDREDQPPNDYDPEEELQNESQDGTESDESEDEQAGTEHYVAVGKSRLRQKEGVSLGPQYSGTRISRVLLEQSESDENFEDAHEDMESDSSDEYDDPDAADIAVDQARVTEDFEIDSDEAFADSDAEKFEKLLSRGSYKFKGPRASATRRAKASDFLSSDDEGSEEDEEDDDGGAQVGEDGFDGSSDVDAESDSTGIESVLEESSDSDELSEEDDESEESEAEREIAETKSSRGIRGADARAEQRRIVSEGQKSLVATIRDAAMQDAQKGLAVQQQRKTFDGLLNIRIRLQKAIVATNSFPGSEGDGEQDSQPYEAAEQAALKLWDTLDSFRSTLLPLGTEQLGEKRKRSMGAFKTSQDIWNDMEYTEERTLKQRKKTLELWSAKTNSTSVEVKSRNLISTKQSIIAGIEEQLLNSERLIKRTRTPRSCAPLQVANKVNEDPEVYDDADFYQLLLKELVDQRTSEPSNAQASSLAMVRWAAMKEAKTKKHVDRRASKGRKMRFNIHEKLQNFMAPEDRRSWEQDAIDRLFGTLFGQKMELNEDKVSDDELMDMDQAEAGLRLFRDQ